MFRPGFKGVESFVLSNNCSPRTSSRYFVTSPSTVWTGRHTVLIPPGRLKPVDWDPLVADLG